MKGFVSLIKFLLIIYLIWVLIDFLLPLLIVGFIITFMVIVLSKKIKTEKSHQEKIIHEQKTTVEKKDEFKNYIISELYKLTEKCNLLDSEKKVEYLKTIKDTLDEFTSRYDKLIDRSYEEGIKLELETEETIKMEYLSKIVKLETDINNEIEKSKRKNVIFKESNELQTIIGKKIQKENLNQTRLVLSK